MIQCQSCSMPLSYDPQGGGTETNGARSITYCSHCYQDGAFVGDFRSAKEMQKFCVTEMVKQGTLRPVAWLLTRQIPRLERWTT